MIERGDIIKKTIIYLVFLTCSVIGYDFYHETLVKATSCVSFSVQESLKNDTAIFEGKVIGTKGFVEEGRHYRLVLFEMARSWKGINQTQVVVQVDALGVEKLDFMMGESYLVYCYKWKSPYLQTNDCKGTKLLSKANDDLAILGEGPKPTKQVNLTSEFPVQVQAFESAFIWQIVCLISFVIIIGISIRFYRKK